MACQKDVKFAIRFKNKLKPGFAISGAFKAKASEDYEIVGMKMMVGGGECFDLGIACKAGDERPDNRWVCIDGTWHICPDEELGSGGYETSYIKLMEKHLRIIEENERLRFKIRELEPGIKAV